MKRRTTSSVFETEMKEEASQWFSPGTDGCFPFHKVQTDPKTRQFFSLVTSEILPTL
jgi:hypothetical protein